ncbi:MAG: hypothetical protein ACPGO3_04630 [Magnetospiraceae bacterium]
MARRLIPALPLVLLALWTPAHAAPFSVDRITPPAPITALALGADGAVLAVQKDGLQRRFRWADGAVLFDAPVQPETPLRTADGLPDAVIVTGTGDIRTALLTNPTERYDHGVLGDRIEAASLFAARADGHVARLDLPNDSVFEDRYPRLVTMDGDPRLLTVRSYLTRGAAVVLAGFAGDDLVITNESPPIGTPNRWLNPVGAGDFDGDGQDEVAVVITPHIGGTLTLFRPDGHKLGVVGDAPGFSNHRLGSRALGLSAVLEINGDGVPDLAVPNTARRHLRLVTFAGGRFQELGVLQNPAEIVTAIIATDLDRDGTQDLIYGTADGAIAIARQHP